jgi:transposase InsO family protein
MALLHPPGPHGHPGARPGQPRLHRASAQPAVGRRPVTHPDRGGPLWLASVRDAYSRRIVGWKASDRADTDLVLGALEYALWGRGLDGDPAQRRLIHHSDSESVGAGAPGLPDPHTDGRARIHGAGMLPSLLTRTPIDGAVFPRICRWLGSTRRGAWIADGVT